MDLLHTEISSWLGRIASSETPPESVIAFNIGLVETPEGYAAYLIGAESYDSQCDDWACAEAFSPTERYLSLPGAEFHFPSWRAALAAVASATHLALQSSALKQSFLGRARAVTVGFDDGDLQRVA